VAPRANKKPQRGRLRIVAGNWRSRSLEIADVPGLRPTAERIRETVFNWLTPHLAGARCLDLFAGTGALGLEALSRGAADVLFVETSAVAVRTLLKNIASLQATNATVRRADAVNYLQHPGADQFEIVFLDPPFADDLHGDLCKLLDESTILAADALVYNVRYSLVKPADRS